MEVTRPRVGLNAFPYVSRGTGIGRYVSSLYSHLLPLLKEELGVDVFLYLCKDVSVDTLPGEVVILPFSGGQALLRNLYEQMLLGRRLRRDCVDLYFSPDHKLPFGFDGRISCVVVMHDLNPFRFGYKAYSPFRLLFWRTAVSYAVRRANRIIAVSESTKRDLLSLLSVPAWKVSVIYGGIDNRLLHCEGFDSSGEMIKVLGLPNEYFLFVGPIHPWKNFQGALLAYHRFRAISGRSHALVVVGQVRRGFDREQRLIRRLGLEHHVRFLGYVDDEILWQIYRRATALLYVSLYEGFGFPVLEAMACGVPVIASNVSSLPEVAGDAAVLVDPRRPADIADALVRILEDRGFREELVQRGLRRAKDFSWESAARQILAIVKELLEKA